MEIKSEERSQLLKTQYIRSYEEVTSKAVQTDMTCVAVDSYQKVSEPIATPVKSCNVSVATGYYSTTNANDTNTASCLDMIGCCLDCLDCFLDLAYCFSAIANSE